MIDPCPICNAPKQVCGDDHITAPVITSDTVKGVTMTSPDAPVALGEYEYYVGHTLIQAQLTDKQAEAIGAVPAGSGQLDKPKVGQVANKEQERSNSQMAEPDAKGAEGSDPEALDKARTTRNRRAH